MTALIAKLAFGAFVLSQVVGGFVLFALPIWLERGHMVAQAWAWAF